MIFEATDRRDDHFAAAVNAGLGGLWSTLHPYAGVSPLVAAAGAFDAATTLGRIHGRPPGPRAEAAAQTLIAWHQQEIVAQMQAQAEAQARQKQLEQQREERKFHDWQPSCTRT